MKSKLNLRVNPENGEPTEVELEVTDQHVSGLAIVKQGKYDMTDCDFPQVGNRVRTRVLSWCKASDDHEVKLPSEPESAYRHIENLMQLGDAIGCGRVD